MTPEEYRRAGELFEQLRERPESEQAAALEGGNSQLRAQVLRLLAADRKAASGGFLENRALDDAASLIVPEPLPNLPAPGTVVGNYRLGARIGAGGMGVVYEAEDLRLNRRVAVKVLPLSASSGPLTGSTDAQERIRRFEREARATSLLNHPHIVSIYDAAFDQGCYYIAMEFVEGRTLSNLIAAESRVIDVKTVLDLVGQAASALVAAHQAGIVHRDIKPENIMVRPDGFIKVLDFGLASVLEASGGSPSDLRTRPGHLAGTIQYLSPEQVLGKPATARSDVFSLGVVAYELATGVRPFDGPTDGAVFEAILNRIPAPPSAVRPALGTELDTMILRALEKDPELRIQTATDLRSYCRGLSRDSSHSPLPTYPHRSRFNPLTIVSTAVVSLAVAGLLWYLLPPRDAKDLLPVHFEQLTTTPSEHNFPTLSPDAKQFVYAAVNDGKWDIYLQRTGGSAAINLTRETRQNSIQPALSPDGAHIAFRSDREGGGLFVMETTGENPRRIAPRGYLPAWSPDNRQVVYSTLTFTSPMERQPPPGALFVVDLESGVERKLTTGDAIQPQWSPRGLRIAYWGISAGGRRDIFTVPASGDGGPVAVTADPALDWNPVWSADGGQLYFLSDRGGTMNVWRIAIDERTGRARGPAQPVTVPAQYVGNLALAANGKSFIYAQTSRRSSLARIGFDPQKRAVLGPAEPLAQGYIVANFTFSPDGSHIVYDTIGDSSENLWIANANGSGLRRLTSDIFRNRSPSWSPQGDRIFFYSDRSGHYDEWLINADGSGLRPLTAGPVDLRMQNGVWSPDGRRILVGRFENAVELDPQAQKPVSQPKEIEGLHGIPGFFPQDWQPGPNGGLALSDLMMGPTAPEVVIYSPADGKLEHTGVRGGNGSWIRGDTAFRYFFFTRGSECFLYDRSLKRETVLFSIAPNRFFNLAASPNGRSIYFTQRIQHSDLWLGHF